MGRWRTEPWFNRAVVSLMAWSVIGLVGGTPSVWGQGPPPEPWHAVVESERVSIHSGRAEQFEKIGALRKGDVLLVKGVNTFGWAAVAPPRGLHAFVARQDVTDGEQRGTVRAIGRVPVLYPISEDPVQCFRRYRVNPDTVMKVLGEVPTADQGVFYKVEMPEQVDVYVLAQFLRKASAEEVAAWKKRLAEQAETEQQPEVRGVEAAEPVTAPAAQPRVESEPTPEAIPAPRETEAPPASLEEPAPRREEPAIPPTREPERAAIEPARPVAERSVPAPIEIEPDPAPRTEEQGRATQPAEVESLPPAAPVEKPIAVTLSNLEQLYEELTRVPIVEAEIEPLLKAYQSLASLTEKEGERRVAEVRIEMLKVRLDHQGALRRLADAARSAAAPSRQLTVDVWRDDQDRPIFTAQGRLTSSNVFDGRRLPLLYRVQDDLTGRTVAYLHVSADDHFTIERRLNLRVGVIGESVFDPNLRLEVVRVQRIVDLDPHE